MKPHNQIRRLIFQSDPAIAKVILSKSDTYEIPSCNIRCMQEGHKPENPHVCPYASELYDCYDICTCCRECTEECAEDV